MRFLGLFVLAILIASAGPAGSQTVGEAYARYNDALAAGNYAEADTAAYQAWSLSDTPETVSKQTAILAYNLAWLRALRGEFSKAEAPAQRAAELAVEHPDSGVDPRNARMILQMAAFAEDEDDEALAEAVGRAVRSPQADLELIGLAYSQLSKAEFLDADHREALKYAEAGLEVGGDAISKATWLNLMVMKGASQILDRKPVDGAKTLGEAEPVLGPQTPGELDYHYIAMRAWQRVAVAMIESDTTLRRDQSETESWDVMNLTPDEPPECEESEWDSRVLPQFPHAVARRGGYGVVTIGYDLSKEGRVVNPEVLYALPRERFEDVILESMEHWKMNIANLPESCLSNQVVDFTFVLQ